MDFTIPTAADHMTSAWLSAVSGRNVDLLGIEPVGASTGLLGSVWRVRVRTEGSPDQSWIVKSPADDPTNRSIGVHFGYYRREALFYRALAPELRDLVPGVVGTVLHVDGQSAIVLEDLGPESGADQLIGADADLTHRALRSVAQVHARFWGRAGPATAGLPGPDSDEVLSFGEIGRLTWPSVAPSVDREVDIERVRRALERFEQAQRSSGTPPTLVHGDFRLDNLFLPRAGGLPVIVDWQLAQVGLGATDVARFLSDSVEAATRRGRAVEFVTAYHDELLAAGVTDYPLDRCIEDVRLGLVVNLPNPVSAAAAVRPPDGRAARLLEVMVRRSLLALTELDDELA
ncbi:MAG: phosphotransferase [Acidimicrobiales bacterium]|nr:phosphotransferase [Acidimicrobiales bacterium]